MNILLIDDDPDILLIASRMLAQGGDGNVWQAESAVEGYKLAEKEQPDVILMDFMLPDMDGPELLARFRKHPALQHVPVVFLTGKTDSDVLEGLIQSGAKGIISKPFDPLTLRRQLLEILGT